MGISWISPVLIILISLIFPSISTEWMNICVPCPAGMHVKDECLGGQPTTTVCEQCPEGSYMPTENFARGCFPHQKCGPWKRTRFQGNATHPKTCTCRQGYHSRGEGCDRNIYCPPGEGINRKGNGCRRCPVGTYSDLLSNKQRCITCSNCTKLGAQTISPCTSDRNAVCERDRHSANVEGRRVQTDDDSAIKLAIQEDGVETQTVATNPKTYLIVQMTTAVFGAMTCIGICFLAVYARRGFKLAKEHRKEHCACSQGPSIIEVAIPGPVQCEDGLSETNPKEREALLPPEHPPAYSENGSECGDAQGPSSSSDPLLPSEGQTSSDSGITDNPSLSTIALDRDQEDLPLVSDMSASMRGSTSSLASTLASSRATSESSLEYRHKVQEALSRAYSNVLTRSAMEHLANDLGQDWKYVARRLGLKEYQIDQILNEHRSNIQEQTFAMIRNWQKGKAGGASIAELYGALLDCNRGELCSKLQSLAPS